MSVSEGKTRRLGVWLDLDHAIKREMETYAGCQNFANEAEWDLILDPDLVESIRSSKGKVSYDGVLGPDPQAAPGQRMGEDVGGDRTQITETARIAAGRNHRVS